MSNLPSEVENPHKSDGFKRIFKAFFYSMEGIGSSLKHEAAFRQEFILALILVPLAVFLPVGLLGKALMVGAVFLVLIVELLNSAIEWTIDYISLESHPYAKRVKDMASAAVFLSLVNCVLIWGIVIQQAVADGRIQF